MLERFEIGIMFDKSICVYEAIEKLQGGSVMGFQFQVYGDRFTARLDNPNRDKKPISINNIDIVNINEVEVDWNADLYGTFTNIEYAHNYSENVSMNIIDKSSQQDILSIHRIDKEYKAETLLANEKDAELKSKILLDDFKELRPIIRNIKLAGEKWTVLGEPESELRIYDIVDIDFRISGEEVEKYPQFLIKLISEVGDGKTIEVGDTDEYVTMSTDEKITYGKREFFGSLRCQVISITPDFQSGMTVIDVRVTEPSKAIAEKVYSL